MVVAAICRDNRFVPKFRSLIHIDAFIKDHNRFIVDVVLNFFDEHRQIPSIPVLYDVIRQSNYSDKTGAIDVIESTPCSNNIKYVTDRLVLWSKWTAIDNVLISKNGSTPQEFAAKISKAARIGDDLTSSHVLLGQNDDAVTERNPIIPTPWPWLNDQLNGGPELGDLCMILTVVSGGKTTSLVNIARVALDLGLFVVYFTFEDGQTKIRRRMMQSICNATRQEIAMDRTGYVKKLKRFLLKRNARCEIKDLQSRRSAVEDAASFIKNAEEIAERKVDLVVSDYMDRYRASSRSNEPRHALREVAEDCKWLARDCGVVHWTARQVNKSRVGKDIISYEHAGESWGSMESPDLVIGIGQTLEDEAIGRMTLYTSKVRDEKDHQTHVLMADFERQRVNDFSEFER